MNRIGRFLIGSSLLMALIAMITPSAATARPPSETPTATLLVTGLEGATGSTVGPDGALYVTESTAGRISRVDPQTGKITTFASGLPKSLPAFGIGGAIDVAFIGKTAYVLVTLVAPDVGGTTLTASTEWTARQFHCRRGHWRVQHPQSANHSVSVRRHDRTPVRAATLPWRVPGHRWAPQPRAAGHPRRRDQRGDCVRRHRPDRAGGVGQHGVHGRGRPRPSPAPGRQGCDVRAEVDHRHGGGLRRPPPRRRAIWPRS